MDYNVLSVDWDFFFPDSSGYDWGHREASFFINHIWFARTNHINLFTKELALESYTPAGFETFWDSVINKEKEPGLLAISESHSSLWTLLEGLNSIEVLLSDTPPENIVLWNFDAHHDLGYGEGLPDNMVDCSNWAFRAIENRLLDKYNLIFPEWKRDDHKIIADQVEFDFYEYDINIYYSIPEKLPDFNMVFVCRSGAWCPTWHDNKWAEFLNWWKRFESTWNYKKIFYDALKIRSPNMEEAWKSCHELQEAVKRNAN